MIILIKVFTNFALGGIHKYTVRICPYTYITAGWLGSFQSFPPVPTLAKVSYNFYLVGIQNLTTQSRRSRRLLQ